MRWEQVEAELSDTMATILMHSMATLTYDIKNEAPVDTGRSKAGYKLEKIPNGWQLVNRVKAVDGFDYVEKLWHGWSQQLPQGHYPTFHRWQNQLMVDIQNMNL